MKKLLGLATIAMIAPLAFVTATNTKEVNEDLKVATYATPTCNAGMNGDATECGFAGGTGTDSDPWKIGTYAQLMAINNVVDSPTSKVYYELIADIQALTGHVPIKKTSNFVLRSKKDEAKMIVLRGGVGVSGRYSGLFTELHNGTIHDIKFDIDFKEEYTIATQENTFSRGAVAGYAEGVSMYNTYVINRNNIINVGSVVPNVNIGGVFGMNLLHADTNISDVNITGGITYTGDKDVTNLKIGGFSGKQWFPSTNPQNPSTELQKPITGISYFGDISVTTSGVIGDLSVGGIFGPTESDTEKETLLMTRLQSDGTITINDTTNSPNIKIGGIVSEFTTVTGGLHKFGKMTEAISSMDITVIAPNANNAKAKIGGITGEMQQLLLEQLTYLGTIFHMGLEKEGSGAEIFISSIAVAEVQRWAHTRIKSAYTENAMGYMQTTHSYVLGEVIGQGALQENFDLGFWRLNMKLTEGTEPGMWLLYPLMDIVFPLVSHKYLFVDRPKPFNPDPAHESSNILLYVGIATGVLLVGGSGYMIHKRKTRKFM